MMGTSSGGAGGGGGGGGMGPGMGSPVGGGGDGRHDDEAVLTEFLSSLMDYTPTIPDELVEHYLGRSGFNCPDLRLTRLIAVATQKFLSDVASDSLQHCKARVAAPIKDNKSKQPKDRRLVLTMDDLSKALREVNQVPIFYYMNCKPIPGQGIGPRRLEIPTVRSPTDAKDLLPLSSPEESRVASSSPLFPSASCLVPIPLSPLVPSASTPSPTIFSEIVCSALCCGP